MDENKRKKEKEIEKKKGKSAPTCFFFLIRNNFYVIYRYLTVKYQYVDFSPFSSKKKQTN